MHLAIIPARGGSKRIKGKNLYPVLGKPLIQYSIEAAISSSVFDSVVVSTDSEDIRRVALDLGAEAPFLRNQDLSEDFTPTLPVVRDAITRYEGLTNVTFDRISCIYPTAPLLDPEWLMMANKSISLNSSKGFVVVAAVKTSASAFRTFTLGKTGLVKPIFSAHMLSRSQDLDATYEDAGAFYMANRSTWMTIENIWSSAVAFPVPRTHAWDIDEEDDLVIVEALLGLAKRRQVPS